EVAITRRVNAKAIAPVARRDEIAVPGRLHRVLEVLRWRVFATQVGFLAPNSGALSRRVGRQEDAAGVYLLFLHAVVGEEVLASAVRPVIELLLDGARVVGFDGIQE